MSLQLTIETKLQMSLNPQLLSVENESHQHNVAPGAQSHFKVTAVAALFDNLGLVKRHQLVYRTLAQEMAGPIHALSLHLYTPSEWQARNQPSPSSPPCLGGDGR